MWGSIGVIGLNIKRRDLFTEFKLHLSRQRIGNLVFSLLPKNAFIRAPGYTALLRNNLRNVRLDLLPRGLYKKNPGLKGDFKVIRSKHYKASEVTGNGQSKEGWRLVTLQGCQEFVDSLANFTEAHNFKVGNGTIQIWGGRRLPPTEEEKKRKKMRNDARNKAPLAKTDMSRFYKHQSTPNRGGQTTPAMGGTAR